MIKRRNGKLVKLTPSQLTFVVEMLRDRMMNPTHAAAKAGYHNPSQAANKLMKNPVIAEALTAALEERVRRVQLDGDRLLEELAYCALRDPIDLCDEHGRIVLTDMHQIPERMRRCIESIKCRQGVDSDGRPWQSIEVRLTPKIAAVELAMRHFGMLAPQKHDVNIKQTIDWDSLYKKGSGNGDVVEARVLGAAEDSNLARRLDENGPVTLPDQVPG